MDGFLNQLTILGFGLAAGIRHGIDFDHIAAITDITGSQKKGFMAVFYSALYGFGHGAMVIMLGIILLLLGQNLPGNINNLAEKAVGITLLLLGFYVLFSITRDGKNFKMRSRWMLVLDAISTGYHKLLHNFEFSHPHHTLREEKYGPATAAGIGLIHGIGAETPTQVGAFLVLLGIGKGPKAILFLLCFVLGIFISNLIVAALSFYGYKKIMRNERLYLSVGIITAVFSIILGLIFIRT